MSEKFQLVLDVAQKAQVRRQRRKVDARQTLGRETFHNSRVLMSVRTEPVWQDGEHPGEDQEVSSPAFCTKPEQKKLIVNDHH